MTSLTCKNGHALKLKLREHRHRGWTGITVKACDICEQVIHRRSARWRCEQKCGYYVCQDCYQNLVNAQVKDNTRTESAKAKEHAQTVGDLMPTLAIISGAYDVNSDDEETPLAPKEAAPVSFCSSLFSCCGQKADVNQEIDVRADGPTPREQAADDEDFPPEKIELQRIISAASSISSTQTPDVMRNMSKFTASHSKTIDLFGSLETATSVGGIEVTSGHSEYLLPPEVVLFNPSKAEREASNGQRLIFLNCKLTQTEQDNLGLLHRALEEEDVITSKGEGNFPQYVRLHALRILQQAKLKPKKAIDVMSTHANMRVKMFPLRDNEILTCLRKGLMYWHGRDRKGRPCLVWCMKRMSGFTGEDAVKTVLFAIEYGIRFALVPGRVENWTLVVDLEGVGLSHSTKENRGIAKSIATILEHVYCGRNFCTKILNLPWVIKSLANSFIPEDKKDKVQFVGGKELREVMGTLFEPSQLEKRYGGDAPDLAPEETYPFRFFPNCTAAKPEADWTDKSLHQFTNREFHEGALWDVSSEERKGRWIESAVRQSLCTESAKDLKSLGAQDVQAVTDIKSWFKLVAPEEAKKRNY